MDGQKDSDSHRRTKRFGRGNFGGRFARIWKSDAVWTDQLWQGDGSADTYAVGWKRPAADVRALRTARRTTDSGTRRHYAGCGGGTGRVAGLGTGTRTGRGAAEGVGLDTAEEIKNGVEGKQANNGREKRENMKKQKGGDGTKKRK